MQMLRNLQTFATFEKSARYICRFLKMLKSAYLLANIGADTGENEKKGKEKKKKTKKGTCENEQHFAEILPIGRRVADRRRQTRVRAVGRSEPRRSPGRGRLAGPALGVRVRPDLWFS